VRLAPFLWFNLQGSTGLSVLKMNDQELSNEVLQLTLSWQQGEAGDEERARLEYLLSESSEARALYTSIVNDTVALAELAEIRSLPESIPMTMVDPLGNKGLDADAGEEVAVERNPTQDEQAEKSTYRLLSVFHRTAPRLAFAASILAVALWGIVNSLPQLGVAIGSHGERPLAKIVHLDDVDWHADSVSLVEWAPIYAGQTLALESGMLELVIDNAVQVVLQGPAEFQLVSSRKAIVNSGKLVARVGPAALGFEIETPHAHIVDMGTAFSITVLPEVQTDVVVYEGKVDLMVRDQTDAPRRRLNSGEGLRIAKDGTLDRITTVEARDFLPPPRLGRQAIQPSELIASVTDTISSQDTSKFYRIVGQGFGEDCPAFVDRLHQWNGIDETGLPSFLLGADYVMTFNDDKVLTDLQIAVELAHPVTMYILWDDRIEPPTWLKKDFSETGSRVGLDESYIDRKHGKSRKLGIGPGDRVDFEFSVWEREVYEASTVVLGPVQFEETDLKPREVPQSMYGIAVTPLFPRSAETASQQRKPSQLTAD
jgi:hypothetical protein